MTTSKLFDISGRVVIVTGGLGQLGRRFCRSLLAQGARVASFDLRAATPIGDTDLDAAAARGTFLQVEANVTERESLKEALAVVRSAWGAPHGLVNCAALDSPPGAPPSQNGPFEEFPVEVWTQVMDVNVKGVFLSCQVVGAAMGAGASVINISSIYGMVSPDQRIYESLRSQGREFFKPIAYSVSKSALFNLTRYLATYWAPKGVRVNTLTLGGVFNNQDPGFVSAYESRTPLGRMARAGEYDGAVVFLLSEAASYMTGANMVVDGGWTAW